MCPSKVEQHLCLRCHHFEQVELKPYWTKNKWGNRIVSKWELQWKCKLLDKYIHKLKLTCKHFLDVRTSKLTIGGEGMVDIEKIPDEGERLELKDLPDEVELVALGERFKEAQEGVAGGLVIEFETREGAKFHQKYTAVSGAVLRKAMKELRIRNTKALQKDWYKYKLTPMRIGRPRVIPFERVKA